MSLYCTFNSFKGLNMSTITPQCTTSLSTWLYHHVLSSITDWEKSIIPPIVVTPQWGCSDTRVIVVHPTHWPNLPLSCLLAVSLLTGTPSTVALTWTACSTSIQGMDLCSCSKAWTERRQLGIIFQSLPLSSVSLAGTGTICIDDVMYWCRVEMYGARQNVWCPSVSVIVTYQGGNSMTSSIPLNIASRTGWMGNGKESVHPKLQRHFSHVDSFSPGFWESASGIVPIECVHNKVCRLSE